MRSARVGAVCYRGPVFLFVDGFSEGCCDGNWNVVDGLLCAEKFVAGRIL